MTEAIRSDERGERLRLLEQARRLCGASEATLWLPGAEGHLRAHLNVGATPECVEGLEVPIQGALVGWVWVSSQSLCTGPDAPYCLEVDRVTGTETLAMIALPVLGETGTVGVLSAINPEGRHGFDAQDLERLAWPAVLLGCLLEPHRGPDQAGTSPWRRQLADRYLAMAKHPDFAKDLEILLGTGCRMPMP